MGLSVMLRSASTSCAQVRRLECNSGHAMHRWRHQHQHRAAVTAATARTAAATAPQATAAARRSAGSKLQLLALSRKPRKARAGPSPRFTLSMLPRLTFDQLSPVMSAGRGGQGKRQVCWANFSPHNFIAAFARKKGCSQQRHHHQCRSAARCGTVRSVGAAVERQQQTCGCTGCQPVTQA